MVRDLALDMVLFLAGSALAVAAIGIIVYRGIPDRSVLRAESVQKVIHPPVAKIEQEPEPQPISEAPPPFSDDGSFFRFEENGHANRHYGSWHDKPVLGDFCPKIRPEDKIKDHEKTTGI